MPEPLPLHAIEAIDPLPLDRGELPASYGKNRLVLLPVDPYLVYAYWELASGLPPTAGCRPVLRFHESTAAQSESRPFDVEVDLAAGNWYVPLWTAGKFYTADLGLRTEDGAFVNLAQSKQVQTPAANSQPGPQFAIEPEPQPAPILEPVLEPEPHPQEELPEPLPTLRHDVVAVFDVTDTVGFSLLPLPVYPVEPGPAAVPPETPLDVAPDVPFHLADLDHLDLTEYTEQRFTPGISSQGGALGH